MSDEEVEEIDMTPGWKPGAARVNPAALILVAAIVILAVFRSNTIKGVGLGLQTLSVVIYFLIFNQRARRIGGGW
jgi:hypothetical protein